MSPILLRSEIGLMHSPYIPLKYTMPGCPVLIHITLVRSHSIISRLRKGRIQKKAQAKSGQTWKFHVFIYVKFHCDLPFLIHDPSCPDI